VVTSARTKAQLKAKKKKRATTKANKRSDRQLVDKARKRVVKKATDKAKKVTTPKNATAAQSNAVATLKAFAGGNAQLSFNTKHKKALKKLK